MIGNEYNGTSSSSNKKSSKVLNNGINEKLTRSSTKFNEKSYISTNQSSPTITPNQQPNQIYVPMSNISYNQATVATAPDEEVLQYTSSPNELYIQQPIQQYPTSPGELHVTSPSPQHIINSDVSFIPQDIQSSPLNYTNSYVIEVVPQNRSTIRYNVDEPPPSYESIMKDEGV